MAQGLKVAYSLHGLQNGLLVNDAALAEGDIQTKAVRNQLLQYLQLDLAHELQVNFPAVLVPGYVELRVLLLQLAELF